MEARGFGVGLAVALVASSILASSSVAGDRVFVNDAAVAGGDGQSWGTAYQYLQDGLTAARNSGGAITEIWVAAGVYRPDRDAAHPAGTSDRAATFQLIDGVTVRGGFAGDEDPATFDLASRRFQANPCILSGDLAGDDGPNFANNAENSYHVVTGSGTGAAAVLDGFTVTGGNAKGFAFEMDRGGGMYNFSGSPTVVNCTFRGNSAGYVGGGIYNNSSSSPTLTNCLFSGNSVPVAGGGVHNLFSHPTLINCVFSGNSGSLGGGLVNDSSNPTLINCTFGGNSASPGYGGAMFNSSSIPVLANCIVWGNTDPQFYGSADVTYSCVQDGWPGEGNIGVDPGFVSASDGNLHLGAYSPCINAGNNGAVPPEVSTDLDGHPRFLDGLAGTAGPQSGEAWGTVPLVDMGAYEFVPAIPGDFNQDGDVDGDDFGAFQACGSGPAIPLTEGCEKADFDDDGDVDQEDFGLFQSCYRGRGQAGHPGCLGL